MKKVIAINGSYRAGRTTDQILTLVEKSLKSAAIEIKIYDLKKIKIEFCTNCRLCTQKAGPTRGRCHLNDEMDTILNEIESADGLILASPVNFFTVTAIMKRFLERLVVYSYWPWGNKGGPTFRIKKLNKRALIIATSAAPGFIIPLFGAMRILKIGAQILGAKVVAKIKIGFTAVTEEQILTVKTCHKIEKALAQFIGR